MKAYEQKRILVRATDGNNLAALFEALAQMTTHARLGFRLYAIELVYERPTPVAAPARATPLPPAPGGFQDG